MQIGANSSYIVTRTLDLLNLKSIPTYPIHRDKMITVSALLYYVIGANIQQ